MKITWFCVMLKSCIIVGPLTVISSFCTISPSAEIR